MKKLPDDSESLRRGVAAVTGPLAAGSSSVVIGAEDFMPLEMQAVIDMRTR
jgi:hypothetical protein